MLTVVLQHLLFKQKLTIRM